MSKTIFFSWQSDTARREGRNLIEKALTAAISRIAEDVKLEEAVREGLTLDKDTQGVSGSPPIFTTILEKIDLAAIYVPDLTFVGKNLDGEPIPNPNVLIEYGWALKSLGHKRIVAVMNEAHGAPTRESLPFDLAQVRYPITYNVPDDAPDTLRREERKKLSETLEIALRAVLESPEFKNSLPKKPEPPLFKPKDPMFGTARFRARGEPLGVSTNITSEMLGSPVTQPVNLDDGAAMWLRVTPVADPARTWLIQDLRRRAMKLAVLPLIPSGGDIGFVRSGDGCGYYRVTGDQTTPAASFVFNTGEVWIINAWLARTGLYFELDENGFVKTIEQCASFLENLGIEGPYRWIVGLEGIKDRQLRIPNRYDRVWGPCMSDMIKLEGLYEKGSDIAELLRPFFDDVFDQCGVERRPLRR
jgi:hypothetical protein